MRSPAGGRAALEPGAGQRGVAADLQGVGHVLGQARADLAPPPVPFAPFAPTLLLRFAAFLCRLVCMPCSCASSFGGMW